MAAQFGKVPHVLERVVDLRLGQSPRGPVGQRLELVELHPGYFADEAGVGDLIPLTDESGGDLGVEHVAWNGASFLIEHGKILLAGVHDLLHLGSGDELEERLEGGERLRVDHRLEIPGRDLHDTELDKERPLAHELGVESERPAGRELAAKGLEILLLFDDAGGSGFRAAGYRLSVTGHRFHLESVTRREIPMSTLFRNSPKRGLARLATTSRGVEWLPTMY